MSEFCPNCYHEHHIRPGQYTKGWCAVCPKCGPYPERTGSTMQIWQLQADVAEWVAKNFPDATTDDQILVLVEEMGELCHALVKSRQGIRNVGREEIKDAVGDIMIAIAAVAHKLDIDLELVTQETWDQVRERDWQTNPETGVKE